MGKKPNWQLLDKEKDKPWRDRSEYAVLIRHRVTKEIRTARVSYRDDGFWDEDGREVSFNWDLLDWHKEKGGLQ